MVDPGGVIPFVLGGLGNQIFNVCAAYVTHLTNGYPLYLVKNTVDHNPHNLQQQDYNLTVFKYFGEHIDASQKDGGFIAYLHQLGYRFHRPHAPVGFQRWNPAEVPAGSIMTHYYQSYEALKPFERQIRDVLRLGIQPHCSAVGGIENAAFLHIRRGDYVDKAHIHYLQPMAYYEKCWAELSAKKPNLDILWIVSDDIAWAKSQPFFQQIPCARFCELKNELETFALMSMCTEGAICANSTFSWWGAFMGAYKHRNPVFVPKRWICDLESPVDLMPSEWTIVTV